MATKRKEFNPLVPCRHCHVGIAPRQVAIEITGDRYSRNYRGKNYYCIDHFGKILSKVSLSTLDVRYLHSVILDGRAPTISHVLHYALALSYKKFNSVKYYQTKDGLDDKNNSNPRSLVISAEKNLPGMSFHMVVTSFANNDKKSRSVDDHDCYKNDARPGEIIDFCNRLNLNLDVTTTQSWADYLSLTQPPNGDVHYVRPEFHNPEMRVPLILRYNN